MPIATSALRRSGLALAGAASIIAGAVGMTAVAPVAVLAGPAPAYSIANVGDYGGEPSIVSDRLGRLYDATPTGGAVAYTSTDHGASWQKVTKADPNSGDNCLATDQANAVYQCNLAGSQGIAPLQADVWKSVNYGTTWSHGAGLLPQCATSCNPFGVDRDWVAASILQPGAGTDKAEVVLMYHDFYGPSQIWVNISTDGGKTFGAPQDVLVGPAFTPGIHSRHGGGAGLHHVQYGPGWGRHRATGHAARGTDLCGVDRRGPGPEPQRLQRHDAAGFSHVLGGVLGRQREDVDPAAGVRRRPRA